MNDSPITFETLNAYVDGELDATTAAEVAHAIAEDPVLAGQVAALSRLRSAVAESIEVPRLSLPAAPTRRRLPLMALAASIVLALLIGGSVLILDLGRPTMAGLPETAWTLHRGWSIAGLTDEVRSGIVLASRADVVPGAYVPDLSAGRLSIVHVATPSTAAGGRVLLVGYRGTRGCKVSLVVFPGAGGMGEALIKYQDGKSEAYAWAVGELGYMLLSSGMDTKRFALLAESVRRAGLRRLPLDQGTRLALRRSREQSAPCLA